ncbi:MAG: AMP-binding protein [Rubritepida sp.]|nr:AMP-binding protein [Rubritepida sp.]
MPTLTPFATPLDALRAAAARHGEREALRFPHEDTRLGFAAWLRDAEALARGLLALGLAPGAPVALLAENRLAWPVVQMGVAAAGLVLVPLNTHYRAEDLGTALAASGAEAILLSPAFRRNAYLETLHALRPGLPALRHVIVLDPVAGETSLAEVIAAGARSSAPLPAVAPQAIGSLQFTSGTTGIPKGALLTHEGMLANAWGTAQRLGLTPEDRWTSIIPLFHCAGCIMSLLGALQTGAAYVGVPAFDPEAMARVVAEEGCTLLSGVPTSWLAMRDLPNRPAMPRLRGGTCGGADCDPAVLADCAEAFGAPSLVQVYGQTESSTLVACPAADDPERFATAGPPLPGMEVRVVDPQSRAALPAGSVGEIQARGPMVMRGYHGRPEATAETITPEGWLRTGDLGALTPEGRVRLAGGRLRDMIIRGGENIYPVEIEGVLARHPGVAEVAVFGVKDSYYGEIVAAALRPRGATEGLAAALAEHCAARIARFKVPARWFVVSAFPLTASGKIRKTELRALAEAGRLEPL